jgi:tripartite-type tricarboxylate transporter receptor subunit TctC
LVVQTTLIDPIREPSNATMPSFNYLPNDQIAALVTYVRSTWGISASAEHIRAGRLRALAVTTAAPADALPGVPTVASFIPGFEASIWFGVGAATNTSVDIVGRLNAEINAGFADPQVKARVTGLGATVLAGSPADFGRLIADEAEKWAKVIKFSGAKAG